MRGWFGWNYTVGSVALTGMMGSRYLRTRKVVPAGVVSIVSLVMTGAYLHGLIRSSWSLCLSCHLPWTYTMLCGVVFYQVFMYRCNFKRICYWLNEWVMINETMIVGEISWVRVNVRVLLHLVHSSAQTHHVVIHLVTTLLPEGRKRWSHCQSPSCRAWVVWYDN